jgi:hypothetical protein
MHGMEKSGTDGQVRTGWREWRGGTKIGREQFDVARQEWRDALWI